MYSLYTDPAEAIATGPVGAIDDLADFANATRGVASKVFAILGNADSLGRPTGVLARLTRQAVNSSLGSLASVDPTGWDNLVAVTTANERARGHLLARWFGGSGKLKDNLVPLHKTANKAMLNDVERLAETALKSGDYQDVYYRVMPLYDGNSLIPKGLTIDVLGDAGDGVLTTLFSGTVVNKP
jgi:hypothetical protein